MLSRTLARLARGPLAVVRVETGVLADGLSVTAIAAEHIKLAYFMHFCCSFFMNLLDRHEDLEAAVRVLECMSWADGKAALSALASTFNSIMALDSIAKHEKARRGLLT